MAKQTKQSPTSIKNRDDTGFNPFHETCKIMGFANEAGQARHDIFTVLVEAGQLTWVYGKKSKKTPGFIAVIDRLQFAAGITSKAWRKLEEKIAKEMCKQRKVW